MAEQWLSIVEYARTYKVSDMTVRRRIKTGKLNAVLQDGKYYIPIRPETTSKDTELTLPSGITTPPIIERAEASREQPKVHQNNEIQIIKGHPTAPRAYPTQQMTPSEATSKHSYPSPQTKIYSDRIPHDQVHQSQAAWSHQPSSLHGATLNEQHKEYSRIPSEIRDSLLKFDSSLVDTKALLSFCDHALRKMQDGERKMIERFKSKLESLESTVAARDQEIKNLKQQLEDLQLLVKILEKRK